MMRYKRTLILLGNRSLVVTVPWEIVEKLNLRKGDKVSVALAEDDITIEIKTDKTDSI